jgi:hypothetical protein
MEIILKEDAPKLSSRTDGQPQALKRDPSLASLWHE